MVGLRSEQQGELGIFVQEVQRGGLAFVDGRLKEGDQVKFLPLCICMYSCVVIDLITASLFMARLMSVHRLLFHSFLLSSWLSFLFSFPFSLFFRSPFSLSSFLLFVPLSSLRIPCIYTCSKVVSVL